MAIQVADVEKLAERVIDEQILELALDLTIRFSYQYWQDRTGNLRRSIRIDTRENAVVIGTPQLDYWRYLRGVPDRLPEQVTQALSEKLRFGTSGVRVIFG